MSSAEDLEDLKRAWKEAEVEDAKRGFLVHLAVYIAVNAFLIFVNLYVSPKRLWFPFVLCGWGIGLTFHFVFSRMRVRKSQKNLS